MTFVPGDMVAVVTKGGFVARPTPEYFTTYGDAETSGRPLEQGSVCLVVSTCPLYDPHREQEHESVLLLSDTGVLGWGDEDWLSKIA